MTAPAEAGPGWSFLYSRRWIGYFSLLIIFSVICVLLGNWQFERRAEARAEIDRIDHNYDSPAVPLESITSTEQFDEDALKWQQVTVTGEYLDEPVLARNRPGPGGVGSHLIVPFAADDGTVFFIDRGWVPVDGTQAGANGALATNIAGLPSTPTGEQTVVARLRASEPAISGRSSSGRTTASIELSEIARMTGTESTAYTGAYGMLVNESVSAEHGILPNRPERDEGPHLSYALQWYVFILIAAAGVVYAARQEYRTLNADSEKVMADEERRAERLRARVSDADEEDALIDR